MTDQELDRLLGGAMQVEHSPEFLPRVRRRVEVAQATPGPETWWRYGVGFVLSAAAIVIAAIVSERNIVTPAVPPAPVLAVAKPASPLVPVIAVAEAVVQRPLKAETTRATRNFPAVLVSPDESRALELVVKAARTGALPAELVRAERGGPLRPIEITSMRIEPLPAIAPLQGDRP